MQTKTVNGKKYYLQKSMGNKKVWAPVSTLSNSDMTLVDVQDSSTHTTITATVKNVKVFPCRVSTSITGMNNGVQHSYAPTTGNEIEVQIDVQWNARRSTELLRVFVNVGTVHQQSFQVEIDDQGNAQVLTGSAKVTTGKG